MRKRIAILLAASLAVPAAPAAAQETNVANAAETNASTNASVPGVEVNLIGIVPPVDTDAAATAVPPAATIAPAEQAYPEPRTRRDSGFPWGLLGLLGLVGLLGRGRANRT